MRKLFSFAAWQQRLLSRHNQWISVNSLVQPTNFHTGQAAKASNKVGSFLELSATTDEHKVLALKHSASDGESASSNEAALGHEDHVDDEDDDGDSDSDNDSDNDSAADGSEEESDTDNSDNADQDVGHADDRNRGVAGNADGDENGDSNNSSDEDENDNDEEQDWNFCRKCSAETAQCELCSDLFCSDCSTRRRWRRLHPDIDYDSDIHAEALDLAHICFNCYGEVMQHAAEDGYSDMF